ncbi:ATP-binding cassette sub-family B member 10, mitochondrial-like isoform X2 [Lingula anatina]|uniref:ATP-binding cassette sub-family B member 10, mitochondrial n=2 Tax=Lingula anatina TaxID=7574 RepID=A0A2R2MP44_LINAN|nr:ATP-binding cassette sub-family B member 10, mitochondrial-like isoform X2 [Lingula anatina]|eukprot:XP_023932001.1 ATP-binding cassette sub-family B member 10, mitochondrial-like isoform X2 [Lingula anatina]
MAYVSCSRLRFVISSWQNTSSCCGTRILNPLRSHSSLGSNNSSIRTFKWNLSKTRTKLIPVRYFQGGRRCFAKARGPFTRNSNITSSPINGKVTRIPKASEIKRLLSLAKPEKWRLAGAIGLLLVSSAVTMSIPFCIGRVIDTVSSLNSEGEMTDQLTNIAIFLTGLFLVGAVANFGRVYLIQISGQRIINTMRQSVFASILRQETAFFDKSKSGELINRLSADTTVVGSSVTQNVSDGLRAVAQGVGGISMMVYVSPKLALAALVTVPPVAVVFIIYGRFLRKITKSVQDSLAEATQVADERISNMRTVRAFAHEKLEMGAYNKKIQHVLDLSYKEAMARAVFFGSTGLAGNGLVLSVFYVGSRMMHDSQITVGDLTSFLMYAFYIGISLSGMSSFYSELNRALGASTRIWEIIDKTPTIPISGGLIPSVPLAGNIVFKDVSFNYPTREDAVIFSGLDLQIPAGSVMAVVGPSGSGKSTLAGLFLRLYDPQKGSITLDGTDTTQLDPEWLRHQTGTVSQEPILFSSTVRENIAYGAVDPESVTMDDVIAAAKKANAHYFIQGFPQGYETVVGERGLMLSGGQRQRVAIARAILKNPKILLLDEATSALDAESEHLVQDALEKLMVGRSVITIAHRLSTIKNADRIAVLDGGKVVELGSYSELTQLSNGVFRKLVERQAIVIDDESLQS